MDEANQQPARDEIGLARDHRREQRVIRPFAAGKLAIVPRDHVVGEPAHGFGIAAGGKILERADADVACGSGCETEIGRREDRLMTPATLQVHMDGIDQDALARYINQNDSHRFLPEIEKMRQEGTWPFPYDRLITVQQQLRRDIVLD